MGPSTGNLLCGNSGRMFVAVYQLVFLLEIFIHKERNRRERKKMKKKNKKKE